RRSVNLCTEQYFDRFHSTYSGTSFLLRSGFKTNPKRQRGPPWLTLRVGNRGFETAFEPPGVRSNSVDHYATPGEVMSATPGQMLASGPVDCNENPVEAQPDFPLPRPARWLVHVV